MVGNSMLQEDKHNKKNYDRNDSVHILHLQREMDETVGFLLLALTNICLWRYNRFITFMRIL